MDEKIRVLVVDDNEELVNIIKVYLQSRGYEVLVAHNAQEAMAHIESGKRIDVLLLDLLLPDVQGPELLKIIRDINQKIGIIVMTGLRDLNVAIEVMKSGADDYITKPFRLGELEEKINEILYKKAMETPLQEMLTAKKAQEILDNINCQGEGRMLKFSFKDIEEMNRFIEHLKNRDDVSIQDVRIGEEMELFVRRKKRK